MHWSDLVGEVTLPRFRSFFSAQKGRYLLSGIAILCFLLIWLHPDGQAQASSGSLPVPAVSKKLEKRLHELHEDLEELFEEKKKTVPTQVFPQPALTQAQTKRYSHLRRKGDNGVYMFTTITRQIEDQLPDLINALLVTVDFLGPENVAFSFLEGPSTDMTPTVFDEILMPLLKTLKVPAHRTRIFTNSTKIDFNSGNRIELLANLRNEALKPLWETTAIQKGSGGLFGENVKAVVFFNDVYLKAEHFLEMLHMHVGNQADISTAWDWYRRNPAWYYDVWVGRTADTGDLFYPIDHAWWTPSESLFSTSPNTRTSFDNLQPFQVFASWNGLAVIKPEPFLSASNGNEGIRFRRSDLGKEECAASECSLLCGDFWKAGYGKVQVVPSIQLAYERDVAVKTEDVMQEQRVALGWRQGVPPSAGRLSEKIKWQAKPPEKIRCHPWPEIKGTSANVWETTEWVKPWLD